VPSIKDRDAGRVAAAYGFDVTRYTTIAIGNVSVDMPAGWNEEDRRIVSSVLAHLRSDLARELRAAGRLERVVDDASTLDAPANALRLDVRITALELDQLEPTAAGNGWARAPSRWKHGSWMRRAAGSSSRRPTGGRHGR